MSPAEAVDVTGRLRELGRRYELPVAAVGKLRTLLERVVSDPLAPTSVHGPESVLDDHIADSLVALELPLLSSPHRVVDIGSGAGFPGLVLAIARPSSGFVLLEASELKCRFIEGAAAASALTNVEVVHARAEDWPPGIGRFGVVTARAVAPLDVVLEYAAPLLARSGALIAWRGRRDATAEAAAQRAANQLGLSLDEARRVVPYPGAVYRHLHLATKIAETPPGFPRRPGMATKRPLGAAPARSSDRTRR